MATENGAYAMLRYARNNSTAGPYSLQAVAPTPLGANSQENIEAAIERIGALLG